MTDLRQRFRALDTLDVPDVLSRARLIGPKPPEPDPEPPLRRVGTLVFAAIVAILALFLITRALDEPAQPGDRPTPTPTDTALRRDGEVIMYSGDDPRGSGDLVAVDPDTGEVRILVTGGLRTEHLQPGGFDAGLAGPLIGSAAWSADGRWAAFEILGCDDGSTGGVPETGLWVTNGPDEHRQLTTRPCSEDRDVDVYEEPWEWSPSGARLVVARRSDDGNALVLIDPATGDRTDLGEAAGDVTSVAWSPDGTRIAYGTVPTGTLYEGSAAPRGSVYSVGVGGGDHALLASSLGYVSGGPSGPGIRWSPDGEHIAVLAAAPENTLYLMSADGSDLDQLAQDVVLPYPLGMPGLAWSPDGTRMTYATFSGAGGAWQMQIWNASPDGSTAVLVFESAPAPEVSNHAAGGPVWSPDGTRIAFRNATTVGEAAWVVANADGTGPAREIDELRYLSWRGGWYFCECYG